jgi:DNA-binding response OmpR family regulator
MTEHQARIAILLEDDANVRGALELLLSDLGWRPIAAASAQQALVLLGGASAHVGAVITDFNLGPGLNGVDETRALAQAGVAAAVLVMSSSMRGRAELAARAAGHDYLPKPVQAERVEAWLAARV